MAEFFHHLFRIVGWSQWEHVPWVMLKSPSTQWEELPTFLIGEYMFFALALCALFHAYTHSRLHLLVWALTFIVGTANDVIFMALPFVDNFWQAQATVMLTPRLPLYIPCVYNAFMYWSTTTAWRLNLPILGEAALAGLLGGIFYFPYDLTGVTFLWWTWHDTYAGLRHRILSVPAGSTTWTVTFVFCFAFYIRFATDRKWDLSPSQMIYPTVLSTLCTTITMMMQMGVLQMLGKDNLPSPSALLFCIFVYLALIHKDYKLTESRKADNFARLAITVYFMILITIGIFGQPQNHIATGLHQPAGPCYVEQFDLITQTTQHQYLCVSDFNELYDFHCSEPPSNEGGKITDWFTVCGLQHDSFSVWLSLMIGVCTLGLACYSKLLKEEKLTLKPLARVKLEKNL